LLDRGEVDAVASSRVEVELHVGDARRDLLQALAHRESAGRGVIDVRGDRGQRRQHADEQSEQSQRARHHDGRVKTSTGSTTPRSW
jgi:hypothetical protein